MASLLAPPPQHNKLLFLSPLLLLPPLFSLLLAPASSQPAASLRFNPNGEFKILQVADMHYANGASTRCSDVLPSQAHTCSDLNTTAFLNRMIAAEQPDLIAFTGDNIFGSDCANAASSLVAAFAPAVAAQIPWAAILGNHDQEGRLTRQRLMQHIVQMKYTLSKVNPDLGASTPSKGRLTKIDGFGNYNLEVGGSPGSTLANKSVLNLYFLDSGDHSTVRSIRGYGWIKASQQAWFKEISAKLQASYKSKPLPQKNSAPGLVYFHIPLPEFNTFSTSSVRGLKQEGISSPKFNSGFLKTVVDAKDVKAVFVGHDHLNDFCGELRGINLCYSGGFGYHAYGKAGWSRRARVVLASLGKDSNGEWMGVNNIMTWKRLDDAVLSTIDTQVLWSSTEMQNQYVALASIVSSEGM